MDWSLDRRRSNGVRRLVPAVLLLSLASAHPSAHNVTPEPSVDVSLRPAGDRLAVQVRVPILALADANLPRNRDGHFAQDQIDPALALVARGIARDLELQQGEDVLPLPTISASVSPVRSNVRLIRPAMSCSSSTMRTRYLDMDPRGQYRPHVSHPYQVC